MKIVACFKLVPEEQDIEIKADRTLSFAKAGWKIGQYDLNAIESASNLKTETEGVMIALTAGGQIVDNSKNKKNILSRGADSFCGIADEAMLDADALTTAKVLTAAIQKIGDVDLVICGEGSGDIYAQQIGPMLGQMLGYTNINAVNRISVAQDKLIVDRVLENDVEVLEIGLPAVISVTTDINQPRIPSMKDILAAGKKPETVWSLADIGVEVNSKLEVISTLAPEQAERKNIILEGVDEDTLKAFYDHLNKVI